MRVSGILCLVTAAAAAQAAGQGSVRRLNMVRDLYLDAAEQHLGPVYWIVPTADGGAAISQPLAPSVIVVRPDGSIAARIGSKGAGPGEFRLPTPGGSFADTLWINDIDNHRITLFDAAHRVVRSISTDIPIVLPDGSPSPVDRFTVRGLTADGALLVLFVALPSSALPLSWGKSGEVGSIVLRVRQDGVVQRPLLAASRPPSCGLPRPACPVVLTALDASANVIATASGATTGPDSATMRVVAVGNHGDTLFRKRLHVSTMPVSAAWMDSISNARGGRNRSNERPTVFGTLADLAVGTDSTVWVAGPAKNTTRDWWVLDQSGNVRGIVSLPVAASVRGVGRNYAWTLEPAASGVGTSVARYRVPH
jgi:hypothetical protein